MKSRIHYRDWIKTFPTVVQEEVPGDLENFVYVNANANQPSLKYKIPMKEYLPINAMSTNIIF